MLSRIRANLTLKPLMDILIENGSKDLSKFESRHINGYIGYKFRSKSIGLHVEGIYEVTVTRDPFAYNIAAELGYEDALYILCIAPDCKKIIGRFSIPQLDIEMEGDVKGKDASRFIQRIKLMYDRREKTTEKSNVVNNTKIISKKSNKDNNEASIHNRYNLFKPTESKSSIKVSTENNTNYSINNKYNFDNLTASHSTNTVRNNLTMYDEESIKREILKIYSERPYRTIVIKDIKKGTTVGIDVRLNKIYFDKCKNTGKMLLIVEKETNRDTRKFEICLENIVKLSNYDSKLLIEVYEREDSIKNKCNLHKPTVRHSSNTVKSNSTIYEESIKREIWRVSSERPYRTIVIKDIKKGTTVGVDARLNKIDFGKCKNTGKMLLIIKKEANKDTRKFEICLDNIVKLSNHNSKFFIEASEVLVSE